MAYGNSIAELMKRKTKKRIAREAELAKREAAGDFRHLQDKQGRFKDGHAPLPQPTLPTIDLADEELYGDAKSEAGMSNYRGLAKAGAIGADYAYPPMPSLSDLMYPAYSESQLTHPRYQLSDNAEDSTYAFAQQNYPYPYSSKIPHQASESFASLINDDKASIRSKDPLLYAGLGMAGGADLSQVSLNRAPSYKTQEEDETDATYHFNQAYQGADSQYGHSLQHEQPDRGYFESDSRHPYPERPYPMDHYGLEQRDSYGFGQPQQQHHALTDIHQHRPSSYSPSQTRSHSPSHSLDSFSHSQLCTRDLTSPPHLQARENPTARGVSVTGRSDITTFYYNEDRDRASMADSQAGAFDFDDYSRASTFNAPQQLDSHAHWQQRQQGLGGNRLSHMAEEVEDEALQQQQHSYPQQHHDDQRDWRR